MNKTGHPQVDEFLESLAGVPWMQGGGKLPYNVEIFETRDDAEVWCNRNGKDVGIHAMWHEVRSSLLHDIRGSDIHDLLVELWKEANKVIVKNITENPKMERATGNASAHAYLLTAVLLRKDLGLRVERKYEDHVLKIWQCWQAGYGVYCDTTHPEYGEIILICYRRA